MLNQDYEVKDYTPEELKIALEVDKLIDQINGKEVESSLAIDIETTKWLSNMRRILTEIKEDYEDYIDLVEPPKEQMEKTKMMLIGEMARLGKQQRTTSSYRIQKRPLWQRVANGIQSAFAPQPTPQLAYRQEQESELKLHGDETVKKPGYILKASIGDKIVKHELTEGEYLIGASEAADIQLADPKGYLSREHAKLIVRDGELFIVDQNSTNGTSINGRKIAPNKEVKIELSDKVSVADTIVEFEGVMSK